MIEKKSAALNIARKSAIDKAAADNRVVKAEKMQNLLANKTKEVDKIKTELMTKDAILALQNEELNTPQTGTTVTTVSEVYPFVVFIEHPQLHQVCLQA